MGISLQRLQCAPSPLVGGPAGGQVRLSKIWRDTEDGGPGRIADQVTVEVDGVPTPASRRVLLLERRSGRVVRSTWSDADGAYAFENLRTDIEFVLLGLDYARDYNAVVLDQVYAAEPT